MENLRSRNDKRLVRNEKDYLKKTSKPSYMAQKNTWQWFSRDMLK